MATELFTNLNALVEEKLGDPSVVRGQCFNYYKVVQHGLTYSAISATNKLTANRIGKSVWVQRAWYFVRSLIRSSVDIPSMKQMVIIEGGRTAKDETGQYVSVFFHEIKSLFGRDQISIIENRKQSELNDYDLHLEDIAAFGNRPLQRSEVDILNDINFVYTKMKASGRFTSNELMYIASAFHIFFEEFHRYYQLFSRSSIKILFGESHYHKEGIIAALKLNDVQFIELQHGLISRRDLYYVYGSHIAPFASQALFPDRILVFGDYWKNMLLDGHEHQEKNILVTGDYSYSLINDSIVDKKNVIFIGAQKNMGAYYIPYIAHLQETVLPRHPEWEIWVKLHPFEKEPASYNVFEEAARVRIFGNDSSLIQLLKTCKIQISIYSTTFYDALGFEVLNLSLQNYSDSADYAAEMVREGVAMPLDFEDDPIEKYQRLGTGDMMRREDVYAQFDREAFKKQILSFL